MEDNHVNVTVQIQTLQKVWNLIIRASGHVTSWLFHCVTELYSINLAFASTDHLEMTIAPNDQHTSLL